MICKNIEKQNPKVSNMYIHWCYTAVCKENQNIGFYIKESVLYKFFMNKYIILYDRHDK